MQWNLWVFLLVFDFLPIESLYKKTVPRSQRPSHITMQTAIRQFVRYLFSERGCWIGFNRMALLSRATSESGGFKKRILHLGMISLSCTELMWGWAWVRWTNQFDNSRLGARSIVSTVIFASSYKVHIEASITSWACAHVFLPTCVQYYILLENVQVQFFILVKYFAQPSFVQL